MNETEELVKDDRKKCPKCNRKVGLTENDYLNGYWNCVCGSLNVINL